MKRVYARESWCINCRRCEVACKAAHSQSHDLIRAFLLEEETAISRIHVEGDALLSIAMSCRHCDEARCVEACISGAMQKDPETGVVFCDQSRCVGCRSCMSACPYGCVEVRILPQAHRNRGLAFKCDLCGEGAGSVGEPACVLACPNRALVFEDVEEVHA